MAEGSVRRAVACGMLDPWTGHASVDRHGVRISPVLILASSSGGQKTSNYYVSIAHDEADIETACEAITRATLELEG